MNPYAALAGLVALAAAAAGGAWVGYDYRDARAGRERAAELASNVRTLERAMEARATAEAISAAVATRTTRALQEARNAARQPVLCPPGGDVRDVVLPDLADRLRSIRAAGGQDPAADVAPAPASGPAR